MWCFIFYNFFQKVLDKGKNSCIIRNKNFLHEKLLKDFMSLFASFSGRYYRIRSLENQQKFLNVVKEKTIK